MRGRGGEGNEGVRWGGEVGVRLFEVGRGRGG